MEVKYAQVDDFGVPLGLPIAAYPNAFLTPTLDFVASAACCVGFKAATTILEDQFS